jgi:hypothetical protein
MRDSDDLSFHAAAHLREIDPCSSLRLDRDVSFERQARWPLPTNCRR